MAIRKDSGWRAVRRDWNSVRRRRTVAPELLEPRWMLCAAHGGFDDGSDDLPLQSPSSTEASVTAAPAPAVTRAAQGTLASLYPSTTNDALPASLSITRSATPNPSLPGEPALNSLPSAPAAIYLDFNGFGSNTPYDEDGDATSFNAAEAAHITECWRQISVYFASFNVNVTTVKPTVPFVWSLISNSVSGGVTYVGTFPNSSPESFNEASDARSRESGIAHEDGHNFGLSHQSDYDLLGNKVNEYSSGFDATHGPIMGVDYAKAVHKWFIGHSSNSPSTLQDDISVISKKIAAQPNGGDGFRPDDFGGTIATATALTASGGAGAAGNVQTVTGIIERPADADAFSFTDDGSRMSLDVNPVNPSGLAPRVEIYDAAGNLLAAKDDTSQRGWANNDLTVPLDLPAGTYYAIVKSHGSYGDIGEYAVTASDLPAGWSQQWVGNEALAGSAKYDASTGTGGTYTVSGSGADVWSTSDQFQYAYTTLNGNGTLIARVASMQSTDPSAKAGLEIRASLANNSAHAAMVATAGVGPQFLYRTATGNSTSAGSSPSATFSPVWVKLVRSGNTFTGYRSTDGVNWTNTGSSTFTIGTTAYVGLLVCAHNNAAVNTATFDNVSFTGAVNPSPVLNALPAPTGLTVAPGAAGTGTALALSWSAVAGATGYSIERSIDGNDFVAVGTTTDPATTTYTDSGLWGSMRYFYRVRAVDATGQSVPSAEASAVNRPNAPASVAVTSWQADKVILNWRDVSGETGYRIERSTDGGATFTTLTTVGANIPSYTDTGLATGTNYSYRVIATSGPGDSIASSVAVGSTRLAAPTGLAFTKIASNQMTIQWNAVPGATGYRIDRSTDGSTFTSAFATLNGSATSYTDTTVSPSGRYYYRVVGTNSLTESVWPAPLFAAAPAATPPPAPWQSQDIGAPAGVGTTGYTAGTGGAGGVFNLIANGNDIWNTADQMRFTSMALVGDGTIVARVKSIDATDPWAKAGVMIRDSLNAGARDAFMLVSSGNGTQFQYRTAANGATSSSNNVTANAAPYWVKLVRSGNTFTGYTSPDGNTWTPSGSATITMSGKVFIGLALTSHTTTTLNSTTFDNVTVTTAPPSVTSLAVNGGAAQRSMVTSLTVNFDRPVASADPGAFALSLRGDSGPTAVPVTATVLPDGSAITLTFSGTGVTAGSLADGIYDLVVNPALVRDAAGQGGTGANQVLTFHRLFGDVDGNKTVSALDYAQFKAAFGTATGSAGYNAAFDFDGNGGINALDYAQFKNRFGVTLNY